MIKAVFGLRRSTDRTQDCGSCNSGSIPDEGTKTELNVFFKAKRLDARSAWWRNNADEVLAKLFFGELKKVAKALNVSVEELI